MALGTNLKKSPVIPEPQPVVVESPEPKQPERPIPPEPLEVHKKNMLVVFNLEDEFFGLPVEYAKEVVRAVKVSRVPQTPNYVLGVSNIRGEVLAVIDLRLLLGLDQAVKPDYTNLLVVKWKNKKLALGINDVPKTWALEESEIQNTSNMTWSEDENQLVKGLLKRDESMVMILDLERIFESKAP